MKKNKKTLSSFLKLNGSKLEWKIKHQSTSPKGAFVPSLVQAVPVVLEKKRLLNLVNAFLLRTNYITLVKDVAHQVNKLESSAPKNALCQV